MARDSPRSTRRHFLTATGATGALAVAGCTDLLGDDAGDLRFILNPAEDNVDLEVQYGPLVDELESELDIEVDTQPTQSYSATTEELDRLGEGDAVIGDASPAAALDVGPDEVDILGVRQAFGGDRYFGTIVTEKDSEFDSVEDLEGEEIVTNTIGSISGGLGPLWVFQDRGLDIGDAIDGGDAEDFIHTTADDHFTAVSQLQEEEPIAAAGAGAFAVDGDITPTSFEENGHEDFTDITVEDPADSEEDADLRLLATTPPLPRAPIVVNADWEADLREDIEEFLLDVEPEDLQHDAFELASDLALDLPDDMLEAYNEDDDFDAGDYDLTDEQEEDWEAFEDHELWFDSINEGTFDFYEPIRDIADDIGLEFEDLE